MIPASLMRRAAVFMPSLLSRPFGTPTRFFDATLKTNLDHLVRGRRLSTSAGVTRSGRSSREGQPNLFGASQGTLCPSRGIHHKDVVGEADLTYGDSARGCPSAHDHVVDGRFGCTCLCLGTSPERDVEAECTYRDNRGRPSRRRSAACEVIAVVMPRSGGQSSGSARAGAWGCR